MKRVEYTMHPDGLVTDPSLEVVAVLGMDDDGYAVVDFFEGHECAKGAVFVGHVGEWAEYEARQV
jgi:hypothetical protein